MTAALLPLPPALPAAPAVPGLRELHATVGAAEAGRVRALAAALAAFAAAPDKAAAAAEIRRSLAPLGVRGVSAPSLYRKLALWRAGGLMALVDGRVLRPSGGGASRPARSPEFVAFWRDLCASNARATSGAEAELMRRLRSGESIPGLGTWRDIWSAEHGGAPCDPLMVCPYTLRGRERPRGLSTTALRRMAPDAFALAAARRGLMHATMEFAPTVPRTRVGLAPCQVVQIDDMWHEAKVVWDGNRSAERVMEFAMMDVLTGRILCQLRKPGVREDDGTLRTLKGAWVRYLLAHLLCGIGIPEAGCLIMGEHGTASADAELRATLAQVSDGKVRFGAGGRLSGPLAPGLASGGGKGNPRYKGLLEGAHSLVKNMLGGAPGNVGGGRGREPENAAARDRATERLLAMADALEGERPGIRRRLALEHHLLYADFCAVADRVYREINGRTDHRLEGWEQCGFVVGEYRVTRDSPWIPMASLRRMAPEQARAFGELIDAGAMESRMRRMSPDEAFESRRGELRRLGPVEAMLVMGRALAVECVCSPRLQLDYRQADTMMRATVLGQLSDGRLLERGRRYLVWINPLAADRAIVADADGRYLGEAAVQLPAVYGDAETSEGMARALSLRSRALADAKRSLAPIAAARQRRAAEASRVNALELLGRDPAAEEEAPDAPRPRGVRPATLDELSAPAAAPEPEYDFAAP